MSIDIREDDLKQGVLGLVLALVEIVRDALRLQALKRMDGGTLSDEECDRLGKALMELDVALEEMKETQGVSESVRAVRDGLDDVVDGVITRLVDPERWMEPAGAGGQGYVR